MRTCTILILLAISVCCLAQTDKKAEKKEVNGIVLFRFIPDTKFNNYYCFLKTKILIDSIAHDFVPKNEINYSIINKNPEFEKTLGTADSYLTGNLETDLCLYRRNDDKLKNLNCDSVLNVYKNHSIYDSLLYNPDVEEQMTLTIKSDAIYLSEQSDTIYIAIQFMGTVIQYENILYGEQSDYRIITNQNGTDLFDESHSLCSFEKYNSDLIVLNKVNRLDKIDNEQRQRIRLKKSKLTELKLFLYE